MKSFCETISRPEPLSPSTHMSAPRTRPQNVAKNVGNLDSMMGRGNHDGPFLIGAQHQPGSDHVQVKVLV